PVRSAGRWNCLGRGFEWRRESKRVGEVHQKKSFRACGACVFAFSASFRASTADAPNAKDREGLARRVAARFSLLSRAGNQSGWGRSIKKSPSAPAARAFLLFPHLSVQARQMLQTQKIGRG